MIILYAQSTYCKKIDNSSIFMKTLVVLLYYEENSEQINSTLLHSDNPCTFARLLPFKLQANVPFSFVRNTPQHMHILNYGRMKLGYFSIFITIHTSSTKLLSFSWIHLLNYYWIAPSPSGELFTTSSFPLPSLLLLLLLLLLTLQLWLAGHAAADQQLALVKLYYTLTEAASFSWWGIETKVQEGRSDEEINPNSRGLRLLVLHTYHST